VPGVGQYVPAGQRVHCANVVEPGREVVPAGHGCIVPAREPKEPVLLLPLPLPLPQPLFIPGGQ